MASHTLEQMEGERWGPPPEGATFLVRRCHELRTKPVDEFAAEDLRIMIGQGISLPILVPKALSLVEADPLAGGDLFPGDLLALLLGVKVSFWKSHHDLRDRVTGVLADIDFEAADLARDVDRFRQGDWV